MNILEYILFFDLYIFFGALNLIYIFFGALNLTYLFFGTLNLIYLFFWFEFNILIIGIYYGKIMCAKNKKKQIPVMGIKFYGKEE